MMAAPRVKRTGQRLGNTRITRTVHKLGNTRMTGAGTGTQAAVHKVGFWKPKTLENARITKTHRS